jgi:hypothetical protein
MTIPFRLLWGAVLAAAILGLMLLPNPDARADPGTPGPQPPGYNCTQTGQTYPTFHPCPGDVTGSLRGGGNHRWPDGEDD